MAGQDHCQRQASPNHYLATAYKIVKKTDPIDWTESGPIYRYPINGAIATPGPNVSVPAGWLDVSGYVLPTGQPGSTAKRIQVSADNGATWESAQGLGQTTEYCWQLWKARGKVTPRTEALLLRAYDTSGGFRPYRVPWNARATCRIPGIACRFRFLESTGATNESRAFPKTLMIGRLIPPPISVLLTTPGTMLRFHNIC